MISIFILGAISVASGFEIGKSASSFVVPSFSSPGGINSNKEVSEVKSDLASVKSRQEETDEKFDKILEQMQSIKSGTKGEEGTHVILATKTRPEQHIMWFSVTLESVPTFPIHGGKGLQLNRFISLAAY
ncbi:uncharacterized protein LOC125383625 [Haliotis rufescens]|uniref:uncharacterized protein LOC125383625 n=1 Tax=Haliotis rufescens TaxID=6454 RepID=UPI00201FA6BF|nr:uncharacterized protein LOC125383625 [Haliotis rufescens]